MAVRREVSPHDPQWASQQRGREANAARRQVNTMPIQDYREHEMDFAATATTAVQHGLGRTPDYWLIVEKRGALNLEHRAADTWDEKTATIYNSTAGTGSATIWFF